MINHPIGKRLGKYEIQAEVGKGGMGMVYQGYDPLLDRRVAVKVLAPHLVWEPGFIERFLREARAAARLKHAGIVTIYDVGQEGNWYYIVMEYLEGQTLSQIIRRQGALPVEQVLTILRQLAMALDYAHQHSLVHRDVKPSNIVVNPAGHVTLTDFGVARAAQETRLTTTGELVGTPQYMSPEQAQGEEVDHRTDVYSLGVVAFEMLAGRAPFGATTPHAVLHQLIYDPPPPLRSQRPELPFEVDHVLGRALAKQAADRYQTAREFVDALNQALAGGPAIQAVPPPEPRGRLPVREPQATRSQAPAARARPERARPRPAPGQKPRPRPARPRGSAPPATARPRLGGWALWFGWFLASAVGWAIGWLVGGPVGEAVGWPISEAVDIVVGEILGGAAAWGALGLVLGTAQWLLLRRQIRKAGWWVPATIVGWAVVGSLRWGQGPVMETAMFAIIDGLEMTDWDVIIPLVGIGIGMIGEGVAGLLVGLPQWLVLQRPIRNAGRWVLISVLAWAVSGGVIGGLDMATGGFEDETMFRLMSIAGGIVPGIVTATGLVWLLARSAKDSSRQR